MGTENFQEVFEGMLRFSDVCKCVIAPELDCKPLKGRKKRFSAVSNTVVDSPGFIIYSLCESEPGLTCL